MADWTSSTQAVASAVQTIVAVAGALFLFRYVRDTSRIRKLTTKQLEAQLSPLLLLRFTSVKETGEGVWIRNLGPGVAFNVQIFIEESKEKDLTLTKYETIPVIEPDGKSEPVKQIHDPGLPKTAIFTIASAREAFMNSKRVRVTAESLSGVEHHFLFEVSAPPNDLNLVFSFKGRKIPALD